MLSKRIIPCLDVKNGRTVKGTNFKDLKDAGDPIALARQYSLLGADELVFLDITASIERRKAVLELVKRVSQEINIPYSVGGGVNNPEVVYEILQHGADKVCINSAAIHDPSLITEVARRYGSQCIVVAMDAKYIDSEWIIHTHGGTLPTSIKLYDWAMEMEDRGCGEILFTSMDHDGTKTGFAIDPLSHITSNVNVPVIASGGAGTKEDFTEVFTQTRVTGALAASIFHYQEVSIPELKNHLISEGINIRPIQ